MKALNVLEYIRNDIQNKVAKSQTNGSPQWSWIHTPLSWMQVGGFVSEELKSADAAREQ